MAPTLSEFIGTLVAETASEDISDDARDWAKICLIHNFAVALAGRYRENIAHVVAATHYGLPRQSTLLHNGIDVSAEGAALANGALFHARSQDDTHTASTSHPGAPIIAAALAVAEQTRASGDEFLVAVILGYEALGRIGRDFDQHIARNGFRPASVLGVFGAAAAVARLLKLDASQTANAIGLASHLAGGLSQVWTEGSPEYPLQLGFAARNGILAARAAATGAVSARFALDGQRGFFNAYAGATEYPHEAYALTRQWQIEEATVKPYPACAILQGPIQLLCKMLEAENLEASDVTVVTLELNPFEASFPGIDNPAPCQSSVAAKMSAQFCLGNVLLRRRLSLKDLDMYDNAEVRAQAEKIFVRPNPDVPLRLCRLHIETTDAGDIKQAQDRPAGRPTLLEIRSFALGLAEEIGTSPLLLDRIVDNIMRIDNAEGVNSLIASSVEAIAVSDYNTEAPTSSEENNGRI